MTRAPTARVSASTLLPMAACLGLLSGLACAPEPPPDAGPSDEPSGPVCTELEDVPCEDQQILEMALHNEPSTRGVLSNTPLAGGGFESHVDATAGGLNAPPESFVYTRFTEDGLEKVELSDEDAFVSMDWDIAFRRYLVRLNSGVSGGSCVTGGRVAGVTFKDLTEVPDNLVLHEEQYFEPSACDFISDGSGLLSSPSTVLSSYYNYQSCLQMNGNVYVVQLANGQHVKLAFRTYYFPNVQEQCEQTGLIPSPTGAGNMVFRWAFLD